MPGSATISLRAYAKRRGVTPMAVSRAVTAGRLSASVSRDARGQPKIADPELADREWDANTDASKAPGYVKERASARAPLPATAQPREPAAPASSPGAAGGSSDDAPLVRIGMSLAEASAAEKVWRSRLAELDYLERSGALVDAVAMEAHVLDVFLRCRTRLLGLSTRARQQLPHLTVADVEALDAIVREALEELANTTPDVAPEEPEAATA